MMKNIIILILTISILNPLSVIANEQKFKPGDLWLDQDGQAINAHGGQVLYDNKKFYWIGENRTSTRRNTGKVNIYSSNDLYGWKNIGVALDLSSEKEKFAIERPKIIYNDKSKMYYMWFHLELNGKYNTGMIGIAESKSLNEPFKFMRKFWPNSGFPPIDSQFARAAHDLKINTEDAEKKFKMNFRRGSMFRDMTLFKDDNGKGYVIYESDGNKAIHVAEMTDDYTGLTGKYIRILVGDMNEAPTIMKNDGKYFLITSGVNGFAPSQARLAYSNEMLGTWQVAKTPIDSANIKDIKTTYNSQGTFIFKMPNSDKYIFMADRWDLKDLDKSTYVWLPIVMKDGFPTIEWKNYWHY